MSYSHLHNCQRIYFPSVFLRYLSFHKSDTSPLSNTSLLFYFFPLLDIDQRCGAHVRFQSFLQHHLEIKGKRADMWWAELLWALNGLNHILPWSNHSQKKKIPVKWPTRQDKLSLSNAGRSQRKTRAISYWCHHPVQSGWNSISLSLHIYRKAVQQSNVASISRHVQICSEQQSSTGLQRRWSPILLFPRAGWDDTLKKTLTELFRQASRIFLLYMSNTCITADTAWYGTLHVNCLTCPLHSINNSSLDINIVIPQGTKMPFFRTKGECTWLEDGDMWNERLVHLLLYDVCMLTMLSLFWLTSIEGFQGTHEVIGHNFPEPPHNELLFRRKKYVCVLLAEFTHKR